MKTSSLLTQMKTRLTAAKGQWPAIAAQAGVDYVWLSKVMQGRITDPGVARVERVIAALDQLAPVLAPPFHRRSADLLPATADDSERAA